MKKAIASLAGLTAGLIVWMAACTNSNPAPDPTPTSSLQLSFDNVVGSQDLQLGSGTYTNGGGETFTVTNLTYYVTNIRLKRADATEYVVPQDSSYFLVKESDAQSQRITLRNIPVGDYAGVSFMIGVDSVRNAANVSRRTGVLDPAAAGSGMYWDWNSGYIHLKLEGTSPQVQSTSGSRVFMYHIGLFGGYQSQNRTLNNLKTISLPFGASVARLTENGPVPRVMIKADVLKIFDGATKLRIAEHPDIMISPLSADVARNYAQMFRVDALQVN